MARHIVRPALAGALLFAAPLAAQAAAHTGANTVPVAPVGVTTPSVATVTAQHSQSAEQLQIDDAQAQKATAWQNSYAGCLQSRCYALN